MRIHLPHPHVQDIHREHILAAVMLSAVFMLAYGTLQRPHFNAIIPTAVPTTLPEAEPSWQKMSIAERAPDILNELSVPELRFQNLQRLPLAYLDGKAFGGRLPEKIWLKLDQPGNTILIAETDIGGLVTVLQDATPGFISPCRLDRYAFGTLQGEPIYFDRDSLKVKALWIIQDAAVRPGDAPGWVMQ